MFLKDLKNIILDIEIDYLATRCAGRTGDDIKKMIARASYDCMEKVLKSSYFVQDPKNPLLCLKETCHAWHPCLKLIKGCGALKKDPNQKDVEFCVPPITSYDLLAAIEISGKTVKPETLRDHIDFADSIGIKVDEPLAPPKKNKCLTVQFCPNCECDSCTLKRN